MSDKTFGPAAIVTDTTDLSKIDPVKIAYRSLMEAIRLLNALQDDSLKPSDPRWGDAHERICEVLDQLTGWDCCAPYRLVIYSPRLKPGASKIIAGRCH